MQNFHEHKLQIELKRSVYLIQFYMLWIKSARFRTKKDQTNFVHLSVSLTSGYDTQTYHNHDVICKRRFFI